MKALILTGGQGTRLRPLTETNLKPLLPLVNLPFLNYPVQLLKTHGVSEVVLCTASSLDPYQEFIQNQKSNGVTVHCSQETKELGTAGAIKNAESMIQDSPFFVFNGDTLTDTDLSKMLEFHKAKKSSITIALIQVADPSSFGLVHTDRDGKIVRFIEKPKDAPHQKQPSYYINGGMYLFNKDVLKKIPLDKKVSSERELFQDYIKENLPIYGYIAESATYWHDIGTPDKFLQASESILKGKLKNMFPKDQISAIGKNTLIDPSAVIGHNVVIGHNCKIGPACVLENCILFNDVQLHGKNNIQNCIIGNKSVIGENSRITKTPALADHTQIAPSSLI